MVKALIVSLACFFKKLCPNSFRPKHLRDGRSHNTLDWQSGFTNALKDHRSTRRIDQESVHEILQSIFFNRDLYPTFWRSLWARPGREFESVQRQFTVF